MGIPAASQLRMKVCAHLQQQLQQAEGGIPAARPEKAGCAAALGYFLFGNRVALILLFFALAGASAARGAYWVCALLSLRQVQQIDLAARWHLEVSGVIMPSDTQKSLRAFCRFILACPLLTPHDCGQVNGESPISYSEISAVVTDVRASQRIHGKRAVHAAAGARSVNRLD